MFIAAEEWNKAKRVAKELEPRYMLISKQTSLIQRNNIVLKFCLFLEIVCICSKNSMSMLLKNELFCRLEAYVDERYKDSLKNQGKAEQVYKQ